MKKGKGTKAKIINISMQLDQGIFNHCFMRALIGVNWITSCDNISLPSLVKGSWKQSRFPTIMKVTSELWWVSDRSDDYPRRLLNSTTEAPMWQLYWNKCHIGHVQTMRSTTLNWRESQDRKSAAIQVIFYEITRAIIKPQSEGQI